MPAAAKCLAEKGDRGSEVDILVNNDRIGAHIMSPVLHVIECALGQMGVADKQIGIPVSFTADDLANMAAVSVKVSDQRFIYNLFKKKKPYSV